MNGLDNAHLYCNTSISSLVLFTIYSDRNRDVYCKLFYCYQTNKMFFFLQLRKNDSETNRCQFHQCSTYSCNTRRSRMCKKRQSSQQCNLALLGPTSVKAAQKTFVKLHQVSISSTFYLSLICTTVFCEAFLQLQFGFVVFWRKNNGKKAACKMLMKLTTEQTFSGRKMREIKETSGFLKVTQHSLLLQGKIIRQLYLCLKESRYLQTMYSTII